MFRESRISAYQLASLGTVFRSAWSASGEQKHLDTAVSIGEMLSTTYHLESGALTRFPTPSTIQARGEDFGSVALFQLSLYQATLDEKWLKKSRQTTAQALKVLSRGEFPLEECQEGDRIIPIHIHNASMVFGESTAGIFDQVYTRHLAISKDDDLTARRDLNTKRFRSSLDLIPIVHTDLLRSFALGNTPLLISIAGNSNTPIFREALLALNSPKFSAFATIASADLPNLDASPAIIASESGIQIGLYRSGKLIGQADNLESFAQIFSSKLAEKE